MRTQTWNSMVILMILWRSGVKIFVLVSVVPTNNGDSSHRVKTTQWCKTWSNIAISSPTHYMHLNAFKHSYAHLYEVKLFLNVRIIRSGYCNRNSWVFVLLYYDHVDNVIHIDYKICKVIMYCRFYLCQNLLCRTWQCTPKRMYKASSVLYML